MAFGTDQSESEENEGHVPSTGTKEIEKYSCTHCSESFRRKDALDRHVFHHTNIKKFQCKVVGCPKSYTNSSHLRRHMKSHAAEAVPKAIRCLDPACTLRYTTEENMRRHFKSIHTNPTVYKCQQCELVFRRKQQLRMHVATHTGEYPYRCENCDRGCMTLKELQHHRASHEYKCDICAREFPYWSALVAHRKIGHQTSHACTECEKTFYSRANLKHHMKIHGSDRRVFACGYEKCSKFYFEKKNLAAHVRSKHEGRRLICDFCGRGLVSKQKLVHHLKLHVQEGKTTATTTKSKPRKPRKDRGKPAKSMALKLVGLDTAPAAAHKAILHNEEVIISDVIPDSSETESIF